MWKPGQLITLWENVYRITKCDYASGYKACMFCQQQNTKPPCINGFDYPSKKGFDLRECVKNMPKNCFPKKLTPKR